MHFGGYPLGRDAMEISLCLLTYNHGHVIGEVLEAILAQTYRDFELIVSDDCSTDNTWEVVQMLASRDSRVRPVQTPTNLGMAGNANFAASLAKGRYIGLLHHDDIVEPTLVANWLDCARAHEEVGFIFNDYYVRGAVAHRTERRGFQRYMLGVTFLTEHLLGGWGCPVRGTGLIRADCWRALGGMQTKFGLLADVDLWMRLARRWPVGYVDVPLIRVRHVRPADYPKSYTAWSWDRLRTLYEIHAENLARVIDRTSVRGRLRWFYFRVRVTAESCKWLLYGLYRRRADILDTSHAGAVPFELMFAGWLRALFRTIIRPNT